MSDVNDSVTRLIELSRESVETARDNVKQEHWRGAYNRLYYACFYAAKALLEAHGYTAETHSGVKTLLSKHFIRTGTIASELGFYIDVMEARLESDYDGVLRSRSHAAPRVAAEGRAVHRDRRRPPRQSAPLTLRA